MRIILILILLCGVCYGIDLPADDKKIYSEDYGGEIWLGNEEDVITDGDYDLQIIPNEVNDLEITFNEQESVAVMMFTNDGEIIMSIDSEEFIKINPSGVIYLRGVKSVRDREFYDLFKEWLERTLGLLNE